MTADSDGKSSLASTSSSSINEITTTTTTTTTVTTKISPTKSSPKNLPPSRSLTSSISSSPLIEKNIPIISKETKKRKYVKKVMKKKRTEKSFSRFKSESDHESESEWENYEPELWEKSRISNEFSNQSQDFNFVPNDTENSSLMDIISEPNKSQLPTTVAASNNGITNPTTTSSTTTTTTTTTTTATTTATTIGPTTDIIKRQRKTRTMRETKKDTDSKKSDLRIDPTLSQINVSTLTSNNNNLVGVISCPNKRFKAVVEIK